MYELHHLKTIKSILFLLTALSFSLARAGTVSGSVHSEQGQPLIGAHVYDANTMQGTHTDSLGQFNLKIDAPSILLGVSYIGHDTYYQEVSGDGHYSIKLKLNLMKEIEIIGALAYQEHERVQMSEVTLKMDKIKSLPSFMGEGDLMRALQLMPGVQSGNEGQNGLYVRGGGPDQNLFLLDGIPLYNVSHAIGLFSSFQPSAISQVTLLKGGFPAQYGGRLSSVVDVSVKDDKTDKIHGEGSVGLVATSLMLEGPIFSEKTSFMISGRRTYIDLLTRPFMDPETAFGYYFYDITGKVTHRYSERDQISVLYFRSKDQGQALEFYNPLISGYQDQMHIGWATHAASLNWKHQFAARWTLTNTFYVSQYQFKFDEQAYTTNGQEVDIASYHYGSKVTDLGLKMEANGMLWANHRIRVGLQGIRHAYKPGSHYINEGDVDEQSHNAKEHYPLELNAFIQDEFQLGARLQANIGLHGVWFHENGTNFYSLQPRLSGRYLINPALSIKGSYANMRQHVHLLTNTTLSIPTDIWVPATKEAPPQNAHQVALGAAYSWFDQYEMSVEGYYKKIDGVIAYQSGYYFASREKPWEQGIERGQGDAYGMEVLIKKNHGTITGWLGYTLAWTNRQFDHINRGEKFPYRYDRRHDVSVSVMKNWSDKIELAMAWVFNSGQALTVPQYQFQGINSLDSFTSDRIVSYGARNSFHMQNYHRLDISVRFKKQKRWGERIWTVGLYNAYFQKNPILVRFEDSETGGVLKKYYFPVMPAVSYQFKF